MGMTSRTPRISGSDSHAGLRDHFAAAALTGLLAAPTDKDRSMEYWARLAYEAADAMLRQRVAEHAPTNPDAARGRLGDDGTEAC